jgi:hypothetical protein
MIMMKLLTTEFTVFLTLFLLTFQENMKENGNLSNKA